MTQCSGDSGEGEGQTKEHTCGVQHVKRLQHEK